MWRGLKFKILAYQDLIERERKFEHFSPFDKREELNNKRSAFENAKISVTGQKRQCEQRIYQLINQSNNQFIKIY